jgi:heterodisulfide reductase subunit B
VTQVSYYPGCTSHSTGFEYGLSLHAVFSALGVELVEIDDWNCCGGAAAHSISNLLGLALPCRNISKAQEHDLPLLVPCPGCFNAVRKAQQALEQDPEMRDRLEEVIGFRYRGSLEIEAVHQVIMNRVGLETVRSMVTKPLTGLRVVSYYGCALVRHPDVVKMGDYENPCFLDEIVEALGGKAVDWSCKTDCCGADLGMTHGDIATEIADTIAGAAQEAEADCVMVTCGLCHVNLDMRQSGRSKPLVPVIYLTELMGTAFDLPGRDQWWRKHVISPRDLMKARGFS